MHNSPKILIVDDSKDSRKLLKTLLHKTGYKDILLAKSAGEAFNFLGICTKKTEPTLENVDPILMDLVMSEIDGIEACRRIKKEKPLEDIPIVMVTANTDVRTLTQKLLTMLQSVWVQPLLSPP